MERSDSSDTLPVTDSFNEKSDCTRTKSQSLPSKFENAYETFVLKDLSPLSKSKMISHSKPNWLNIVRSVRQKYG